MSDELFVCVLVSWLRVYECLLALCVNVRSWMLFTYVCVCRRRRQRTYCFRCCSFIHHTQNSLCIAIVWIFILLCIFNTFCSCCCNPHTSEITCKVSLIRPKSHPTEKEKSVEKGKIEISCVPKCSEIVSLFSRNKFPCRFREIKTAPKCFQFSQPIFPPLSVWSEEVWRVSHSIRPKE